MMLNLRRMWNLSEFELIGTLNSLFASKGISSFMLEKTLCSGSGMDGCEVSVKFVVC